MDKRNLMSEDEKIVAEKRHPVLCANCGTEMVGMNKYVLLKDNNIFVWYICPRRQKRGEKGCGHQSPVELNRMEALKQAEVIKGFKLVGQVRLTDKVAMLIQDNEESFETWLRHNSEKLKDKRVEVTVRIINDK